MRTITAFFLLLAINSSAQPVALSAGANTISVRVESVVIDGQAHSVSGVSPVVIVPASTTFLDIHYTSASNNTPASDHFRYLLRGRETDWTDAGNTRVARFTKLPPGRYAFEVQAADPSGAWGQSGSTLTIAVEPTITPIKIAGLGALLLLLLGIAYFVFRKDQQTDQRV